MGKSCKHEQLVKIVDLFTAKATLKMDYLPQLDLHHRCRRRCRRLIVS